MIWHNKCFGTGPISLSQTERLQSLFWKPWPLKSHLTTALVLGWDLYSSVFSPLIVPLKTSVSLTPNCFHFFPNFIFERLFTAFLSSHLFPRMHYLDLGVTALHSLAANFSRGHLLGSSTREAHGAVSSQTTNIVRDFWKELTGSV